MHILWTIIIGFFAGVVAKLLMPGRDPGGFIITTLLGIAGALLAKYLGMALGFYSRTDKAGFIASVIGAFIILAIYHVIRRRTTSTPSGH
ncbi:MAG: transglycosylase [Pedosphaera sp.]|nr:transglycosylase [Pedosphaera sp.]